MEKLPLERKILVKNIQWGIIYDKILANEIASHNELLNKAKYSCIFETSSTLFRRDWDFIPVRTWILTEPCWKFPQ